MANSSHMGQQQNLLVDDLPGPPRQAPTQRASRNGGKPHQPVFVTTQDLPGKSRPHPLLPIGITVFCITFLFFVWNVVGQTTLQKLQNQWHYGDSKVVALNVQLQGDPVQHTVAAWVYRDHSGATWLMVMNVAKGEKPVLLDVEAGFPDGTGTTLTLWPLVKGGNQGVAISTQGDDTKTALFLYGDGHGGLSWSPPNASTTIGS